MSDKPQSKRHSIGTEKESALHKALKYHYAGSLDRLEVPLGPYICDGITGKGELIEVQTGSFGPIKEKARNLCAKNKLKIIHPIVINKYIAVYDEENKLIRRRKSPGCGCPWNLFKALVYDPTLPGVANLRIELVMIDLEESRVMDGCGSWRRKGASITEKRIIGFHGSILLKGPQDYCRFIPFKPREKFTAKALAEKTASLEGLRKGISCALARKTLYVLLKLGLVERIGKEKQSWVYKQSGKYRAS